MFYHNTLRYKFFIALAVIPMLFALLFATAIGFAVLYIVFAVMMSKVFVEILYDKYKARQDRRAAQTAS